MKEKLKESQVKSKNLKNVNEDDIIEEIILSDFVLCTVDKPQRIIRRLINKMCVQNNKPVLFCGFSEYVPIIGPFIMVVMVMLKIIVMIRSMNNSNNMLKQF